MRTKLPKPPEAIKTTADGIPRICPACASSDIGKIDYYGRVTMTCQACNWTERYIVQPAVVTP